MKKVNIKANGTGNLLIQSIFINENEVGITIEEMKKECYGIGTTISKDVKPKIKNKCVLSFVNSKSIDVVIEKLIICKEYLESIETKKPAVIICHQKND